MGKPSSILEYIREYAENHPDDLAVIYKEKALSFSEVHRKTNQLAHFLKDKGISNEDTVGLCLNRSELLTIGMIGIMKSGATYIPLDPEHPESRRNEIINDTQVKLVLTESDLRSLNWTDLSSDNLELPGSDQVAYIMYTSGSTGKPKGVMVDHGNLVERFEFAPYKKLVNQKDRVAGITAASWNPSIYESIYTLASGAAVVIFEMDEVRDPQILKDAISQYDINFIRAVPSLFRALVDAGWEGKQDITIVSHGDKLQYQLAHELRARGKGVFNTFGSTEATVFSMLEITDSDSKIIPISTDESSQGKILILKENLEPVKHGDTGEVFIAGRVVAKGYYGDEELTAKKFLKSASGERLYRTGDVARSLSNGQIEFLGRADNQVKIRGQRIELGEVESAIADYSKVKAVVGHTYLDKSQNNQLVAYVITNESIDTNDLREFVASKLPTAAVPSLFIFIDKFPLNHNGKVDRSQLPHPLEKTDKVQNLDIEGTEKLLYEIFSDVLGHSQITKEQSFFEMGGHSLLAALVCTRLSKECNVQLSLKKFYELKSISNIAKALDSGELSEEVLSQETIEVQSSRQNMPLSFAQERLWFMNKLSGDDSGYNIPFAIKLQGDLDLRALEKSFQLLQMRHETLRTKFHVNSDGKPEQSIESELYFKLQVSKESSLDKIREEIAQDASNAFNLGEAPLYRHKLFKTGNEEYILYVNFHHIISDGWSKAVFKKELVDNYNAFSTGKESPYKPLDVQYIDFAIWNRSYVSEPELQRQIDYWVNDLKGVEPLNMPTDRPRPKVLTQTGAIEKITLSNELLNSLKDLALKNDSSLYMVLLTAFKILINKYSSQKDLAIGSPYAGRVRAEVEEMIGFFVNTIIIRTQMDTKGSYLNLLNQVKEKTFNAFDNKDLSFERLVSELNPERDLSRYPITQTIFALQNTPYDEASWSNLSEEEFQFRAQRTRYDLELHAWEREEGLLCHLIYNTDLFDAWRMKQFISHFETLLKAITSNPSIELSNIDLLSDSEKNKILKEWNNTEAGFDSSTTINKMVEQHANSNSGHLAVLSYEGKLTYKELNAKANQIANALKEYNVKKGDRVAVNLCRSVNLILAKLAIMKLGAVYMPIDPDYPEDRKSFMISDSGSVLVIDDEFMANDFSSQSIENIETEMSSEDLIYMIYTSGSTGKPKGATIAHKSLVNLIEYIKELYSLKTTDSSIYYSGPAFDASAFEIWSILANGATLYIPDPNTRLIVPKLLEWIDKNKINLCFFTTGIVEQVLSLKIPESVRTICCGGDRLISYPPAGFPKLFNLYGPTENTVISTACEVHKNKDYIPTNPTIGKPISNHQCYIVDEILNPVPIGVAGELLVGGLGLATGYHERAELTAEKFIDNPFASGKVYKTGDLARYLPNGEIEFLGRIDHQVQLRGYRIEIGEINNVLLELDEIGDVYTLMREDTPGDPRLVSYISLSDDSSSSSLEDSHVEQWQTLYDREYTQNESEDTEFNITGWNSSFSGDAIPAEAMQEWVDETVARMKEYSPKNVLEVGCGTGLLLYPLSRSLENYVGTDISPGTIKIITEQVSQIEELKDKVKVHNYPAHDFSWIDESPQFNFAVTNSVIQYFPSEAYLFNLIEDMVKRVKDGGAILVGDVRNHDQIGAFHLKVELSSPNPESVTNNLQQKVEGRMKMDKELLTSPDFFRSLPNRIPRVSSVEVKPKKGHHLTEMNMFRYDVILHIQKDVKEVTPEKRPFDNIQALEDALKNLNGNILFTGIKDKRNSFLIEAFDDLYKLSSPIKVDSFLSKYDQEDGIAIDDLYDLGEKYNLHTEVRWEPKSKTMQAFFSKTDGVYTWEESDISDDRQIASSDPLQFKKVSALRPKVREHLSSVLPEYMIPSSFMFLDELPLTPNGKIDIKALPEPANLRPELQAAYKAPEDEVEKTLVGIFAKALGIEVVGVEDNFFELGGHSLLAVQLINQVEDKLSVEMPLSKFFEDPRVIAVADFVKAVGDNAQIDIYTDPDYISKIPLNSMDLNFHFARFILNDKKFAWYQVMELETGSLNIEKLKQAALYAVNVNPMARGRISSIDALGDDLYWDVSNLVSGPPLEIIEADNNQAAIVKDMAFSPLSIEEAPLCRFVLIKGKEKDRVLLRYNHGAIDGSGIQSVWNSLMSHYCDVEDPAKKFVPFTTEQLYHYYQYDPPMMINNNELAHIKGLFPKWLMPKFTGMSKWINTSILKPHKIQPELLASSGGRKGDKTSFAIDIPLTKDLTDKVTERAKELKVSLDRLFMLGILQAAKSWNQSKGKDYERIEAYWAVNLRPPKLFDSIVANQIGWSRLRVTGPALENEWKSQILDPSDNFLTQGALDWTQAVGELLKWPMPNFLKKIIVTIAAGTAPTLFISNTLTLSISGVESETLPQKFGVKSMRNHSFFGATNRPIIVIGKEGDCYKLRMTSPRSLFDEQGAQDFINHCIDQIGKV